MTKGRGVVRLTSTLASSATSRAKLTYVPKHCPPREEDVQCLSGFVEKYAPLLVLTGAGVSTESGIPDYRSEGVGLYARTNRRPMEIKTFMGSHGARRFYWARNFFGWPGMEALQPNESHRTLRMWEEAGMVRGIVTQNVDGLHGKAGSRRAVELHGTAHTVKCLGCGWSQGRTEFQGMLMDANPHLRESFSSLKTQYDRPDGDVDLEQEISESFVLPDCPSCGGILKPDIVFFGDNVPKQRVELVYDELVSSRGLVILGSSLQTFSAFRYVLRAKERGIPILLINLGSSRADSLVTTKLTCRIGEILPLLKL